MDWLLFTLILFVALALLAFLSRYLPIQADEHAYQKQKALFTPAERSFLGVLNQAVGDSALIFGKVRVADVLKPAKGMSRSNWQKSFNKIINKHFDFLLCDPKDLSMLCAIELNDRSHDSIKRKGRDIFLENACRSAGLPLIQVPAKAGYSIPEIQEVLLQALR